MMSILKEKHGSQYPIWPHHTEILQLG